MHAGLHGIISWIASLFLHCYLAFCIGWSKVNTRSLCIVCPRKNIPMSAVMEVSELFPGSWKRRESASPFTFSVKTYLTKFRKIHKMILNIIHIYMTIQSELKSRNTIVDVRTPNVWNCYRFCWLTKNRKFFVSRENSLRRRVQYLQKVDLAHLYVVLVLLELRADQEDCAEQQGVWI